jgi:tetratricopeptide (TPR) repeat protein
MRAALIALALGALATASPAQVLRDQQTREEARKHYRAGEEYMQSEAFEGAEREFKAATELDSSFVLAYYGLGQARMALKRYAPAVEAYTAAKDTVLREASLDRHAKAEMDQRRRDEIREMEDALARMRNVIVRGPGGAASTQGTQVALEQRISVLKDQQMRGDHGATTVPAEISLGLGSAYFRLGQMQPAEQNYRAAVAVDNKMGAAHNNLAVIYMLTGRFDEAGREVQAAEKAGFTVSPQFKQDLKQRSSAKTKP